MRIVADLHTHTIASGHAYSTVNELASEAGRKGLAAIAITDHGPTLPGGPHHYHFAALRFVPNEIDGVRIFLGAELNIIDRNGSVDLPAHYLERLDFVMAGLHEGCGFDSMGASANTDAIIAAMQNPHIKAISHPGNPIFPFDYTAVLQAAEATGTALEFNNASFSKSRGGSRPNCEKLARLLANSRGLAVVGSDAHIAQGVGEFSDALAVLDQAGVKEDQVVNSSMTRLLTFLDLPA